MPSSATWLTKLKVQLKLAIARLRMVQQRDEQLGKTHRRAMAQLLEAGKEDSATIRVENIIRADITSELHELLELYCELLLARAGLLDGPVCDPGLEEAVKSLIYAAPKTEIKELVTVRTLLVEKYGKEFVLTAMDNTDGKVNEKIVKKLSVEPPRKDLVQGYLEEIAKAYIFGGQAQKVLEEPLVAEGRKGSLGDEELSRATPPRARLGEPRSPLMVTPPRMTTDNVHPKVTLGSVELKPSNKEDGARKKEPEGSVPDISDLERRFAALKKRIPVIAPSRNGREDEMTPTDRLYGGFLPDNQTLDLLRTVIGCNGLKTLRDFAKMRQDTLEKRLAPKERRLLRGSLVSIYTAWLREQAAVRSKKNVVLMVQDMCRYLERADCTKEMCLDICADSFWYDLVRRYANPNSKAAEDAKETMRFVLRCISEEFPRATVCTQPRGQTQTRALPFPIQQQNNRVSSHIELCYDENTPIKTGDDVRLDEKSPSQTDYHRQCNADSRSHSFLPLGFDLTKDSWDTHVVSLEWKDKYSEHDMALSKDYICRRCNVKGTTSTHFIPRLNKRSNQNAAGHHIKDCPTNSDPAYDPLPKRGYVCNKCGAKEKHFMRNCPRSCSVSSKGDQDNYRRATRDRAWENEDDWDEKSDVFIRVDAGGQQGQPEINTVRSGTPTEPTREFRSSNTLPNRRDFIVAARPQDTFVDTDKFYNVSRHRNDTPDSESQSRQMSTDDDLGALHGVNHFLAAIGQDEVEPVKAMESRTINVYDESPRRVPFPKRLKMYVEAIDPRLSMESLSVDSPRMAYNEDTMELCSSPVVSQDEADIEFYVSMKSVYGNPAYRPVVQSLFQHKDNTWIRKMSRPTALDMWNKVEGEKDIDN
ncbi:IST1-like protein [Cladobotryum mycophilum]|uniref:IST1-like protein n=1 Tax=Cladobotryum mycophilum TaxID=491253 RepID=A0ABR0T264_9HYPO